MVTDTHTPMPTLDVTCTQTRTHTFQGAPLIALLGALPLHAHTQLAVYERFSWWWHTHTHTHAHAWLLAQTYFLLHADRSISLACMRRYTQLAYLFHQCATSLLSRDGHIADCTVRYPSVKHSYSSFYFK